jgi:hypothetical protein
MITMLFARQSSWPHLEPKNFPIRVGRILRDSCTPNNARVSLFYFVFVYIFLVVITLVCYVSRISINVLLSSNFLISTKDCVSAYKRSVATTGRVGRLVHGLNAQ